MREIVTAIRHTAKQLPESLLAAPQQQVEHYLTTEQDVSFGVLFVLQNRKQLAYYLKNEILQKVLERVLAEHVPWEEEDWTIVLQFLFDNWNLVTRKQHSLVMLKLNKYMKYCQSRDNCVEIVLKLLDLIIQQNGKWLPLVLEWHMCKEQDVEFLRDLAEVVADHLEWTEESDSLMTVALQWAELDSQICLNLISSFSMYHSLQSYAEPVIRIAYKLYMNETDEFVLLALQTMLDSIEYNSKTTLLSSLVMDAMNTVSTIAELEKICALAEKLRNVNCAALLCSKYLKKEFTLDHFACTAAIALMFNGRNVNSLSTSDIDLYFTYTMQYVKDTRTNSKMNTAIVSSWKKLLRGSITTEQERALLCLCVEMLLRRPNVSFKALSLFYKLRYKRSTLRKEVSAKILDIMFPSDGEHVWMKHIGTGNTMLTLFGSFAEFAQLEHLQIMSNFVVTKLEEQNSYQSVSLLDVCQHLVQYGDDSTRDTVVSNAMAHILDPKENTIDTRCMTFMMFLQFAKKQSEPFLEALDNWCNLFPLSNSAVWLLKCTILYNRPVVTMMECKALCAEISKHSMAHLPIVHGACTTKFPTDFGPDFAAVLATHPIMIIEHVAMLHGAVCYLKMHTEQVEHANLFFPYLFDRRAWKLTNSGFQYDFCTAMCNLKQRNKTVLSTEHQLLLAKYCKTFSLYDVSLVRYFCDTQFVFA